MRNKQKQIGTHDGAFHCDEALACWMLHQTLDFRDASITRTRLCLPSHTSRPFCLLPLSCAGVCGCCGDNRRAVVDSACTLLAGSCRARLSCRRARLSLLFVASLSRWGAPLSKVYRKSLCASVIRTCLLSLPLVACVRVVFISACEFGVSQLACCTCVRVLTNDCLRIAVNVARAGVPEKLAEMDIVVDVGAVHTHTYTHTHTHTLDNVCVCVVQDKRESLGLCLLKQAEYAEKSAVNMRQGVVMDGIGQTTEAPERACTHEAGAMRQERGMRQRRRADVSGTGACGHAACAGSAAVCAFWSTGACGLPGRVR
jgi:hypothetical protein